MSLVPYGVRMTQIDFGLLILRIAFGVSIFLHGWNKWRSPSGISGTASWFRSIGMKWPHAQAYLAAASELIAGVLFATGLLTGVASAILVALMFVAIVTVHWKVGYFIFLPNGGWEYCAAIIAVAIAISLTGAGSISLDHALNVPTLASEWAVVVGLICGVCHLLVTYRPSEVIKTS